MAIGVILKELFPGATNADLTELAEHYIKVHGPIPVDDKGQPIMTAGQFVQQHLRQHLVNLAGSSVHKSQQEGGDAAVKAVMARFAAL